MLKRSAAYVSLGYWGLLELCRDIWPDRFVRCWPLRAAVSCPCKHFWTDTWLGARYVDVGHIFGCVTKCWKLNVQLEIECSKSRITLVTFPWFGLTGSMIPLVRLFFLQLAGSLVIRWVHRIWGAVGGRVKNRKPYRSVRWNHLAAKLQPATSPWRGMLSAACDLTGRGGSALVSNREG